MKIIIVGLLAILTIACGFAPSGSRKITNPVFVFNNAFNKADFPKISYAEQATIIKSLGFNGIEHRETQGLLEITEAFHKAGLKVYTDYVKIDIDQAEPYQPEWKKVIPLMKGRGLILWVHVHSGQYRPSDEAADDKVVKILRELADFSKPYGVRVAIYHHENFLVQKVEDSYRIALKANRENIGSVFNLCHFLKTDTEENLNKVIDLTFPKLFAVSISGADSGDTRSMDWDRLIQPLGEGTFDTYQVVEKLIKKGYNGPIGIQCYALKGDPRIFLKKSSDTWKLYNERLSGLRKSGKQK